MYEVLLNHINYEHVLLTVDNHKMSQYILFSFQHYIYIG